MAPRWQVGQEGIWAWSHSGTRMRALRVFLNLPSAQQNFRHIKTQQNHGCPNACISSAKRKNGTGGSPSFSAAPAMKHTLSPQLTDTEGTPSLGFLRITGSPDVMRGSDTQRA